MARKPALRLADRERAVNHAIPGDNNSQDTPGARRRPAVWGTLAGQRHPPRQQHALHGGDGAPGGDRDLRFPNVDAGKATLILDLAIVPVPTEMPTLSWRLSHENGQDDIVRLGCLAHETLKISNDAVFYFLGRIPRLSSY